MAEKTKEQLQTAAEKAAQALQTVTEKLEAAQKALDEKPEDEKLKKQVEGLTKCVETAKEKLNAAQDAVKEAEETKGGADGGESTGGSFGEDKGTGGKKIRLKVRNKTGRPTYYRAGLCFGRVDAEYEVTKGIADILQHDPWLVAEEIK